MIRQTRRKRPGAVTVEFALAAPAFFLLIFAGFEFSRVNMIRNTIANAAYDGARQAIVPGATANDCRTRAQAYLDLLTISGATVNVTPDPISNSTTDVTVTVQVPVTVQNAFITPRFFLGRTLNASVTLPREMAE